MELITSQIEKIEDLLAKMDEIIDTARSAPFSANVKIEKEALFNVIDEIRAIAYEMKRGLPYEINQAKRLLSEKDSQLSEAKSKADNMINDARITAERTIKAAEEQAGRMLNEHEITVEAKRKASEIVDAAFSEANDFKLDAARYIDDIFQDLDRLLQRALEEQVTKAGEIESFYADKISEIYHSRQALPLDGK